MQNHVNQTHNKCCKDECTRFRAIRCLKVRFTNFINHNPTNKAIKANKSLGPTASSQSKPLSYALDRQQKDGSWKYARNNAAVRSQENYDQIETFRQVGYLVESFGFDRSCIVVRKAAEFLFSFQTAAGDIRGILGNQYSPYYTAAILELLIKSGYTKDERIERAFAWLKSIRQNDGGWAIPLRTVQKKLDVISMKLKLIEPDKSKPSAHLVTGVVLRAYAAHERYRYLPETRKAGELLLSNLFKKDNYADRRSADYWLRFTFPFGLQI